MKYACMVILSVGLCSLATVSFMTPHTNAFICPARMA